MSALILLDLPVALLALYFLKYYLFPTAHQLSLPPGPPPLPLIGNLLDLPTAGYDWLHWAKHHALYGPISALSVFGQSIVLVNDHQIAIDLFEKRSSIYSDRPTLVFGGEMCGWENSLALLHYGDRFRQYRKVIHNLIGSKSAAARFIALEELETRRLLARIASSPDKLQNHVRTLAGAVILKISHGYTIEPNGPDPLVDLADEAVEQFSLSTVPGAWLVDSLPILRHVPDWLPGTSFKRTARRWRKKLNELAERPHAFVRHQMAAGTATPSFTSALLEPGVSAEEEDVVKWAAMSLYGGGADTTVSAIHGFFLAMALHPAVQRKAQAELDFVTGTGTGAQARLPTLADRARLPYVDALVREVLRWHPVAPMGLPHVNIEEDTYSGYRIPKGSLVMANIWHITHNPANYRDPETFAPERFLGANPELDPYTVAFGFGRRICPGKELAESSVWLALAMSLAVFDIAKARGARGEEIEPLNEVTSGIISHTKPFQCSITPRSDAARALIFSVDEEHPHAPAPGDAAVLANVDWPGM